MYIRVTKSIIGLLLLKSTVEEFWEQSYAYGMDLSIVLTLTVLSYFSLLLIHSGIMNKNYKWYFNYKALSLLIALLLIPTIYYSFGDNRKITTVAIASEEAGFNAKWPGNPMVKEIKPNPNIGILSNTLYKYEEHNALYVVNSIKIKKPFFSSRSEDEILKGFIKAHSIKSHNTFSNIRDYSIPEGKAYMFDLELKKRKVGIGMICKVHNRILTVICHTKIEQPNLTSMANFIDSINVIPTNN